MGERDDLADAPVEPVGTGAPAKSGADIGLFAVAAAFLLPVAYSPSTYHSFWAPKAAVALLLIGPGLVALARLMRAGNRAAIAAAIFVGAAGVSTLASDNPALSLFGPVNWSTGFLSVFSLAAAWALGSVINERRRREVVLAIIAAALLNALVAWLQVRGAVPPALRSPGRAAGLMGNPVYLGALTAGSIWLVAERVGRGKGRWLWLAPIAVLAGAAQTSGSRSAAALALLALLVSMARAGLASSRGRTRGAAILVAAIVGFSLASAGAGGAALGTTRVAESSTEGIGFRLELWRLGLDATVNRPVFGWGPGRFQAATSPRYTREIAGDGRVAWFDPHNWIVDYLVTTGIVGVLLLLTWLYLAARRSAGPLAGFAATIGLFMLVEPQFVGLSPIALLALGVASRERDVGKGASAGIRPHLPLALAAVGSIGAATMLVTGEYFLNQAFLHGSVSTFNKAHSLLPAWPEVSVLGSQAVGTQGLRSDSHARRSLALAREAGRRDPADPSVWSYVGKVELQWGTAGAAAAAFDRSLALNPWLVEGLKGRIGIARGRGDDGAADESCRRLRLLEREPIPACSKDMPGFLGSSPTRSWRVVGEVRLE